MSEELSVDLAELRRSAARQRDIAERARLAAAELKSVTDSAGAAWGADKPGKAFEEFYLPSAQQSAEALDRMVEALDTLGADLAGTADTFESEDLALGSHIDRADPHSDTPAVPSAGPAAPGPATPPLTAPARYPSEPPPSGIRGSLDGQQFSDPGPMPPSGGRSPAGPGPDPARNPGSDGPARPEAPAGPAGGPGQRQTGQAPVSPPGSPGPSTPPGHSVQPPSNRPGGTAPAPPASPTAPRNASTPWSSGSPKNTDGLPGRGASAPPSSGRPGEMPPPRPPAPSQNPPRKPEKKEPPPRPAPRPAARSTPEPAARPSVSVRRDVYTDPEALRIAGEMATRHGLTLRGFEGSGITESAVRELADALDAVLTTHHLLDLRVVEIAETLGTAITATRWDHVEGEEGPATRVVRLLLNREKFAEPAPQDPGAPTEAVPAPARPLSGAVVRELGRALDSMGGYAARRKVQRALIRYFLDEVAAEQSRRSLGRVVAEYRQWRTTLPGASAAGIDPAATLVEAFAAVVAKRPHGVAEPVYRLLIEAVDGRR